MEKFTLTIKLGNAAFEPDYTPELVRILRTTASQIEQGQTEGNLRDVNGNKIGTFDIT